MTRGVKGKKREARPDHVARFGSFRAEVFACAELKCTRPGVRRSPGLVTAGPPVVTGRKRIPRRILHCTITAKSGNELPVSGLSSGPVALE
jgi:hypothetical protein